ncbi:hypothetical protein PV08_04845 [Exophiala spinifera]|uniref:GATA-type domain-containing protein n=1 Tax=Exophiala spinifera TaxID=91928 RepID=A0A0D2BG96_9EURO|nr:uncharacterized protein PV08_04845 [Exophiala spinifera]KIW17650.1 hypothetical protein PV08_04845 [Exophiala spinifera]
MVCASGVDFVDGLYRDTLPPISHLDLDAIKSDSNGQSRFTMLNGLSISTAPMSSPTTTMYSGPPAPYSCAPSTAGSASGLSGYISPPESTTRRSTRDERESPGLRKSLPSIHEALGDRSMSLSGPLPAASQQPLLATPTTTVGQSFPDGPKGPANPFSQPPGPAPVLRDVFAAPAKNGSLPDKPPIPSADPRQPVSQHFGYPGSPPSQPPPPAFRSSSLANTSFSNHNDHLPATSPQSYDPPKTQYPLPQFGASATSNVPVQHEPVQFGAGTKGDLSRPPYSRPDDIQFSDSVKRHLDVFDAELGFNEISEASAGTLDFARVWAPRFHHGSRSGYFHEALPSLSEIDDALRQSHRTLENLTHLRELVLVNENAKIEERARQAEEYRGLPDGYRNPGLADRGERDAKKHRRGQKAAPPGRCHSCNRAETPEWRRGPDGARTLCNACGLHYAKLTRKMGLNKAAALTGSGLRPKHLDQTRP